MKREAPGHLSIHVVIVVGSYSAIAVVKPDIGAWSIIYNQVQEQLGWEVVEGYQGMGPKVH